MGRDIEAVVEAMRAGEMIRFAELCKVCDHYFGTHRQQGTSHRIYKMPWAGDPRVNIQDDKGKSKRYQIKQVLAAIDKLSQQEGK